VELDLTSVPYDDWVRLVFDHPVGQEWYWQCNISVPDPPRLLDYFARLCADFPRAVAPFDRAQIDQGLWLLLGACVDIGWHLIQPTIPREKRIACIESMSGVYAAFVARSEVHESETCFFMWWDLLTFAIVPSPTSALSDEQREARDAMLSTLVKILALDGWHTQRCALHGLGHLHHPDVGAIVQRWIDAHGEALPPKALRWVEECRDGTME